MKTSASERTRTNARGRFLSSIVERTRRLVGGDAAALCILDRGAKRLEVAAGTGRLATRVGARARAHQGMLTAVVMDEPDRVTCVNCAAICCPFDASWSAHHHIAVPVRLDGDVRGVLCATSTRPAGPSIERDPLLPALGDLAAGCLGGGQVVELAEELGALSARRQLAADMHDGVAQTMAHLQLQLDATVNGLSEDSGTRDRLVRLRELFGTANTELRTVIGDLHRPPEGLCELSTMLEGLVRAAWADQPAVWLRIEAACRVPRSVAEQVRLVVHEAVANAVRHAAAQHITVRLAHAYRDVVVSVTDDGCGFDASGASGRGTHLGLGTMRLRGEAIGGRTEVSSRPGAGTTVTLSWST